MDVNSSNVFQKSKGSLHAGAYGYKNLYKIRSEGRKAGADFLPCSADKYFRTLHHLQMVLSALPDIEIQCTDSCECFDDNRYYIKDRIRQETNQKVIEILKKDLDFIDNIRTETSTARQFLFIMRCRSAKPEQLMTVVNRTEKIIADQGFEVKRMSKSDIKRFLAIYFDASMDGDKMPDYDGQQFIEQGDYSE